jgi:hypothetical protein
MTKEFNGPPEERLFRDFLSWLESARRLWREFEKEGVQVPATLIRLLSDTNHNPTKRKIRRTVLRKPEEPEKPKQAGDDWLWLDAKEASLRTVVLAVLNEGNPLPIKEVINKVKEILPNSNKGSIYNLGAQEDRIQKTDQGWTLRNDARAPVLYKNFVWGSPELLQKQDLAAFRRMAVRYLLETSPDGLQIMQVYRQLEGSDWLKVPLSKDLIKEDLFLMRNEKKVRQLGGKSKKWTINKNSE